MKSSYFIFLRKTKLRTCSFRFPKPLPKLIITVYQTGTFKSSLPFYFSYSVNKSQLKLVCNQSKGDRSANPFVISQVVIDSLTYSEEIGRDLKKKKQKTWCLPSRSMWVDRKGQKFLFKWFKQHNLVRDREMKEIQRYF